MGLSVFTSGKSTTLSDVSLLNYLHIYLHSIVASMFFFFPVRQDLLDRELEELDYELKVQGITDTSSFHIIESGLELHHAAAMGQLEYVRFLVEKKYCNPSQHVHGNTAFHIAAISGNLQILKYFITETNCNPAYPGPLGLTCLHLASQQGHLDIPAGY